MAAKINPNLIDQIAGVDNTNDILTLFAM